MKTMADLAKDQNFRKKLAQSFIPYSKSLTEAWSTAEYKGNQQEEWGKLNADAVFLLDQQVNPSLTAKEVYLKAADLRRDIEIKLRGNENYAKHRFTQESRYLYTAFYPLQRYGDQFNEGLNYIAKLPYDDPDCERHIRYFFMKGYPNAKPNKDATFELAGDEKQLLAIETYQHYLNHEGKRIKLAVVRVYQWFKPSRLDVVRFFDTVNAFNSDIDDIFDFIQKNNLDLWNSKIDLSDAEFYSNLSRLMRILYQTSPLHDGSAAASEVIMKLCLIRRFLDGAPIFSTKGLSIDIAAMLSTESNFDRIFRSLLSTKPLTPAEISSKLNLIESHASREMATNKVRAQYDLHRIGVDITEDLESVGLFRRPRGQVILEVDQKLNTNELVDFYLEKYALARNANPGVANVALVTDPKSRGGSSPSSAFSQLAINNNNNNNTSNKNHTISNRNNQ